MCMYDITRAHLSPQGPRQGQERPRAARAGKPQRAGALQTAEIASLKCYDACILTYCTQIVMQRAYQPLGPAAVKACVVDDLNDAHGPVELACLAGCGFAYLKLQYGCAS